MSAADSMNENDVKKINDKEILQNTTKSEKQQFLMFCKGKGTKSFRDEHFNVNDFGK